MPHDDHDQDALSEQINIRLSKRDLAAIDADIERREKAESGVQVSRSDLGRIALRQYLERIGARKGRAA